MAESKDISHLLLITPGFPADEDDTSCLPAIQQFILAYRRVYPAGRISVLTLHYPHHSGKYTWHQCEVFALGNKSKGGIFKAFSFIRMLYIIKQLNNKHRVDAILSFWLSDTALAGKILSEKMNVPHLIWMHGQDAKAGNKYVNRVKPDAGQLAAISTWQGGLFKDTYGFPPGHIINNGINKEVFPRLNTQHRDIDLLAAGSLVPLKRYDIFVELVSRLKQAGMPEIKAVLAGEGIVEEKLKRQIIESGLENNIRCTGKIDHKEVLALMNNAKIFVHPSSYEGESTVMLEALYSGCRVVSFVPLDRAAINHYACTTVNEMDKLCKSLLQDTFIPQRVLYNNMEDSVGHVHEILSKMQGASGVKLQL